LVRFFFLVEGRDFWETSSMKILTTVVRILLGLVFFVFGSKRVSAIPPDAAPAA